MPMVGEAVAHGCERPSDVHTCTAAREEQVVVEFVLLGRGTLEGRALN